jgi:transcription initiation factor TFIIB
MQSSIVCSTCNRSGSTVTDPDSGEVICNNCGMVITDKAQQSNAEWRSFGIDDMNNKSRTGIPISLARHDKGLSTLIGRTNKDASGQGLNAASRTMMERLRTWDLRTQANSPTDRNLRNAFNQLNTLKDKLMLPDAAVEKTAYIYRKVQERGLVRGRTIAAVLSAVVYIVCRETAIPRTLDDIAGLTNIKQKELARVYRLIVLELDLKIPMVDKMKCIAKVANKAMLSEKTKREAMKIMNVVTKKGISAGKDPMGLAGSIIYLCSTNNGESKNQIDIAEAAGVTEVTIRNRLKEIKKQLLQN